MPASTHPLTRDYLVRIADSVGTGGGWDFIYRGTTREPVPWHYSDIVQRYLSPTDVVLDTGTGTGEYLLSLASHFSRGVGIDVDRRKIEAARARLSRGLEKKLSFQQMSVDELKFPDEWFDVVLNRHAIVNAEQIARVLRPGGLFLTEQIGPRDAENVCHVFGCAAGGYYRVRADQAVESLVAAFSALGCTVVAHCEYNVTCYYHSIASFVSWLKAVPIPQDFDMRRHWEHVAQILAASTTPRGIRTNEHRILLIVRKP